MHEKYRGMDYLSVIKQPILKELDVFVELFNESLTHNDGLLGHALSHIRRRGGKRMRPMLIFLLAKNYGEVSEVTQRAAVGIELLHTASLVHDDVVDESSERRGQASVNASYNNKVAVLVGDYILSTSLLNVSFTKNQKIIQNLSELGRTLSNGEILQLTNIQNQEISEDVYYQVIKQKTAALFESCASMAALSVGASEKDVEKARLFGQNVGIIFQIRDDIFDYYDATEIGKPTGNDMAEGKLTLPVIYALNHTHNKEMMALAKKVKEGRVEADEIARLVAFAKSEGGIDYAHGRMVDFACEARRFIAQEVKIEALSNALNAYIDFVIERTL